MYNREVKSKFINQLNSQNKRLNAEHVFYILEELEESTNIDVYDIPYDVVLKEILDRSNISSYLRFLQIFYIIKEYKIWARDYNYMSDYARVYVDANVNTKFVFLQYNKVTLYRTPEDVVSALQTKLHRKVDELDVVTIDEIVAAYIMLIYQGFDPEEALNIQIENIKITNQNVAIINDKKAVLVYPAFKNNIIHLTTCRKYLYKHANMEEVLPLNQYLVDNGKNASVKKRRQNMMTILNNRGMHIKLKDLYYMGKLYDYYRDHPSSSTKSEIYEYCFYDHQLTKTMKEQFYRFIELWNM